MNLSEKLAAVSAIFYMMTFVYLKYGNGYKGDNFATICFLSAIFTSLAAIYAS